MSPFQHAIAGILLAALFFATIGLMLGVFSPTQPVAPTAAIRVSPSPGQIWTCADVGGGVDRCENDEAICYDGYRRLSCIPKPAK